MTISAVRNQSGDALTQEFEEIFREHYQLVYRTAYGVTGNRQDAEDVLQTIFVRLIQRKVPPDLWKNPKGYLYRSAINLSLNVVRSRKRESMLDDVAHLEAPAFESASEQDDEIRRWRLIRSDSSNPGQPRSWSFATCTTTATWKSQRSSTSHGARLL